MSLQTSNTHTWRCAKGNKIGSQSHAQTGTSIGILPDASRRQCP